MKKTHSYEFCLCPEKCPENRGGFVKTEDLNKNPSLED